MIAVLSPAKSLDYESEVPYSDCSEPEFLDDAEYLVKKLKKLSSRQLQKLMDISPDLAELNYERFAKWQRPFNPENSRQAIYAFAGDVYQGFEARELNKADIKYAQNHIRILSGLYGILKPLDLMQPYRLEMGTSFKVTSAKDNLYKYWGDKLARKLNEESKDEILINLASQEYFKAIQRKSLKSRVITPIFKDEKNGEYKIIAIYAKQARGNMAKYIVKNRIDNPGDLTGFDGMGYTYNPRMSSDDEPVFTR